MGCCLTTQNPTHSQTQPESEQKHQSLTKSTLSLEEETVKEVLSQNPIKPNIENEPQPQDNKFEAFDNKVVVENEPRSLLIDEKVEFFKGKNNEREVIRQKEQEETAIEQELSVSETYSFSLSESTCVSTTTMNNDDDYEVKQPPKRLPPRNRVRGVNKSPVRRSGQSPEFHNNVGGGGGGGSATSERSVYSRELGINGRKIVRSDPIKSFPGESRMSKSPAPKRYEIGRGQSPGRVTKDPQESKLSMSNSDDTTETTGHVNETLENPLVSLECFIFL